MHQELLYSHIHVFTLNLGWTLHWCWVWHHHSLECWCRCNTGYLICTYSWIWEVDDKMKMFARMLASFLLPVWTITCSTLCQNTSQYSLPVTFLTWQNISCSPPFHQFSLVYQRAWKQGENLSTCTDSVAAMQSCHLMSLECSAAFLTALYHKHICFQENLWCEWIQKQSELGCEAGFSYMRW